MRYLTLICAVGMLLAAAGCPGSGKVDEGDAKVPHAAAAPEQAGASEANAEQDNGEAAAQASASAQGSSAASARAGGSNVIGGGGETGATLPAEEAQALRETLARVATDYDCRYDAKSGWLTGENLPPDGVDTEQELMTIRNWYVPDLEGDPEPPFEPQVRAYIQAQQAYGRQARDTEEEAGREKEAAAAAENEDEHRSEPTPPAPVVAQRPENIVGDWVSDREELKGSVVKHSDQYYEMMLVSRENTLAIHLVRGGELFSRTEFPYTYSRATGVVSLMDGQGNVLETWQIDGHPDGPEFIKLTRKNRSGTTVFKRLTDPLSDVDPLKEAQEVK